MAEINRIEQILLTSAAVVIEEDFLIVVDVAVCNDDYLVTVVYTEMCVGSPAVVGVTACRTLQGRIFDKARTLGYRIRCYV